MVDNQLEKIIVDEIQEGAPVHIPVANYVNPGIASFNSTDFIVTSSGAVSSVYHNPETVFIRYSVFPDGTNFTVDWDETKKYIGIYVGVVAPLDKALYKWSRFMGGDGTVISVNEVKPDVNGDVPLLNMYATDETQTGQFLINIVDEQEQVLNIQLLRYNGSAWILLNSVIDVVPYEGEDDIEDGNIIVSKDKAMSYMKLTKLAELLNLEDKVGKTDYASAINAGVIKLGLNLHINEDGVVDASGGGGFLELGETEFTAYRGDKGKIAYDHSQITEGNPHGTLAETLCLTIEDTGTVEQELLPNVFYDFTGELTSLAITFEEAIAGRVNEYMFQFLATAANMLTVPASVKWANDFDITALEVGLTYQVSIENNIGIIVGVEL